MTKYTFKVYPAGRGREVYRVIEMAGGKSLDDLCGFILDCFEFDHDHLYEFCMDNKMYSEDSYQRMPEPGERSTRVRIDNIRLFEKQKFLLHYDFGDDWQFVIGVQKIVETEKAMPRNLIKSKGNIVQYPDYYDDEDED